MENNTVPKYTISFGLSLALSSVINALLVVAKEENHTVLTDMQKVTGHHWITHSAVIVVLFISFGWLFARAKGGQGFAMPVNRLIKTIGAGILTASVIIVGFYLMAD